MSEAVQFWEILALPFYLLVIYLIANGIQKKNIDENPLYRFYLKGLFAKIFGGICLALIYTYYWPGADSTNYFESAEAYRNLLLTSPSSWLANEFGKSDWTNMSLFSADTGYPWTYMYFNPQTLMVIRVLNPLLIFTFNSYLITTIILAWLAYAGMWRLFLVFSNYYPTRSNLFAFGILFFPSVLFWGSGILKDAITLSCTGWVVYCIYMIFILKKKRLWFCFILLINLFLIINIKPYIIIALIPGSLMWIFSNTINKIQNAAFKFLVIPLVLVTSVVGGTEILSFFGNSMGKFSVDKITATLVTTQNDLKQDYYHGHSFDIGLTDASTSGLLKKSPVAIIAGLYRPFLWESGNVVMLISGLENTLILYLTISSIFRISLVSFFRKLLEEPLLFFALSFSIFFAFSVGISTANFGALVRFKIAYLPFFICSLFILVNLKGEKAIGK
jgi:hypothetical protein